VNRGVVQTDNEKLSLKCGEWRAPGGTRVVGCRCGREVVSTVACNLSSDIERRVAVIHGVRSAVAPPQTTLRLMSPTLTVVTVRRHLTQYTLTIKGADRCTL